MEKDLDIELYNEYLDGNKEAFESLYNKYEKKIQYFVYNIIKDYQKAEDKYKPYFALKVDETDILVSAEVD